MFVNTCVSFFSSTHANTHTRTHASCTILYDMCYYGGNYEYI